MTREARVLTGKHVTGKILAVQQILKSFHVYCHDLLLLLIHIDTLLSLTLILYFSVELE